MPIPYFYIIDMIFSKYVMIGANRSAWSKRRRRMMTHDQERIWLIEKLKTMNPAYSRLPVPKDEQGQKDTLRMLMNVWMPLKEPSREFLEVQDSYLRRESIIKGIVDEKTLLPCEKDSRLYLWQGDITRLKADAITNAANSAMLGCFQPLHSCIDNFIHSAAGIELRWRCKQIMDEQGCDEPTGQAKITPGYCLPAKHVLHTVGPIVPYGDLQDEHRRLLRSSYLSCLELAAENGLTSIAFCCISTGVFMFPAKEAAEIAVATVREYLDSNPDGSVRKVIFDVFSDRDKAIYDRLLH